MAKKKKTAKLYVGVDVGGTKILAALARANGKILARKRATTPRSDNPEDTVNMLIDVIRGLLAEAGVKESAIRGIGMAVPGIVDAHEGRVVVTPNMNLTGYELSPRLEDVFHVPIALGNDVNVGTLGEQWLGSAAYADSAVGIFVGTGIGGGIILNGRLVNGHGGGAGEVGHLRMMPHDGPLCGCGAHGCLEALASRTAIERDIRQAVAAGRETILTQLIGADMGVIRSSVLKKALQENDALVQEVMGRAADYLGEACLQIRHLLDPEVIVLGGGVVEACKPFILPIVQRTYVGDSMSRGQASGKVVASSLGDDAVVLGAVALAQQELGRDPFKKARRTIQRYPTLAALTESSITVGEIPFPEDIYIRVDGKVLLRAKALARSEAGPEVIDAAQLRAVCKRKPSILIIGTGQKQPATLTPDGENFLRHRGVTYEVLPTPEAVATYNAIKGRKAVLLRLA